MSEKEGKLKPKELPTGDKVWLDGKQVTYLRPCKSIKDWSYVLKDDHVLTVANERLTDGRAT